MTVKRKETGKEKIREGKKIKIKNNNNSKKKKGRMKDLASGNSNVAMNWR